MVTSVEPKVDLSGRYSINETCQALGIHRHTLRAYVKAGLIRPYYNRNVKEKVFPRTRFLGSEILRFWRSYV